MPLHARRVALLIHATVCARELAVAPAYTIPASFQVQTGKPVSNVSVIFGEVCVVTSMHQQLQEAIGLAARQELVFAPELDMARDPHVCKAYLDSRQGKKPVPEKVIVQVPIASCSSDPDGAVYPCPGGGFIDAMPNKYCREQRVTMMLNKTEARWMAKCSRTSAPMLVPEFEEWFTHPDNINHVGRDLAYLASMFNLGRRNGYVVFAPGPSPDEAFSKMNAWGKSILKALQQEGLKFGGFEEEAARFAKVSLRFAQDAAADSPLIIRHGNKTDVEMQDISPCGIVCGTTTRRYGVTGFNSPEDAKLLQQSVLKYCHLPVDPPQNRSLLLITRKTKRVIHNLQQILEPLENFAHSYGLDLATVDFGSHPFCEQVRIASTAYIMVGIQGADPSNMFFQHADGALIEMYGRDAPYWESNEPNRHSCGITAYLQQLAAAGRIGVAAKLFNVTGCTDGNWMYNAACILDLDVQALIQLIQKWVPKSREWQGRSKELKELKEANKRRHALHGPHHTDGTLDQKAKAPNKGHDNSTFFRSILSRISKG